MQTLGVISVNIWSILISLCNLLIIFLIIKKFLFSPVKKVLAEREAAVDSKYSDAENAKAEALEYKNDWENKIKTADTKAQSIIDEATLLANKRGENIISAAEQKADSIIRNAEIQADLERKKAEDDIKAEIVSVSAALSEKLLEREINANDHKSLIDSFINKIGEDDDANQ